MRDVGLMVALVFTFPLWAIPMLLWMTWKMGDGYNYMTVEFTDEAILVVCEKRQNRGANSC